MADDSRAGDASAVPGIPVPRPASMARRIMAMLGMAILIALLTVLVWRVYLHHEFGRPSPDPAVVSTPSRAA